MSPELISAIFSTWTVVVCVLMVGIVEMGLAEDETLNMAKIGTKLVVVLIITVLAFVGRKRPLPQTGIWGAIGALTLLNVILAVFW